MKTANIIAPGVSVGFVRANREVRVPTKREIVAGTDL